MLPSTHVKEVEAREGWTEATTLGVVLDFIDEIVADAPEGDKPLLRDCLVEFLRERAAAGDDAGDGGPLAAAEAEAARHLGPARPATRPPIPLALSSGQQSFLAETCSLLRAVLYQREVNRPMDPAELADRLFTLCERFGVRPTDLDALYDKLHRTGANA